MENSLTSSDPIAPLRAALAGRYEILREIGQGAFARVYLANDSRHDRKVAIKVLNAEGGSESGEVRFVRRDSNAFISHPKVVAQLIEQAASATGK
ncbi:MAG: hypothetical protein ACXU9O_14310 [Gemmatimonadaceae bacterium]